MDYDISRAGLTLISCTVSEPIGEGIFARFHIERSDNKPYSITLYCSKFIYGFPKLELVTHKFTFLRYSCRAGLTLISCMVSKLVGGGIFARFHIERLIYSIAFYSSKFIYRFPEMGWLHTNPLFFDIRVKLVSLRLVGLFLSLQEKVSLHAFI